MEELENKIQKNITSVCKLILPHIETWCQVLEKIKPNLKGLQNFSQQLKHVERANIKYMDDFDYVQRCLMSKILDNIEEELLFIKNSIERLNKSNQDFKNRLITLERSTVDVNWNSDSQLIIGTALQPPLNVILQKGHDFSHYFARKLNLINDSFKSLDIRNQQSVTTLCDALDIDLKNMDIDDAYDVMYFLSLTQYIVNEKAVN